MSGAVSRREACRLCGGRSLELALSLAPTPLADAYVPQDRLGEVQGTYPLDLFLCRTCGHVQLLDVVNPEILYRDYAYATSTSLGLVEHFRRTADDLLVSMEPAQGSWVVEIGSNDGSMLRRFKEQGMRVLGVDPAREIARKATESGVETLPDFFTSSLASRIRRERGPAALITANNVFAHADDLSDVTAGIWELLSPDGAFVFEVSYLADILQKRLFDTVYHEHLCYHSVRPLAAFFHRHGMELIDALRIPTKGGSLRVTVQRAGGPRSVSPSVEELTALEERMGLARIETFRSFADQLGKVKAGLLDRLREIKHKGGSIAGYGASHTVTTLLHHFDLAPFLSFLVDDNPCKQGLFSPGHHIPVFHPRVLYSQKPEVALILAWNYSQPILAKHQPFLAQGGRFLLPLPNVEEIGFDA
ncbi:MAG: class I SAM-dependent methyltransferase [Candidatus Omnitrophica bacterium]|nr:class I SAM-dependent methyltransferase [Candidatus Omnitrophota bacterium]